MGTFATILLPCGSIKTVTIVQVTKPRMMASTTVKIGLSQIVRGPLGAAPFAPGTPGLFGFAMVQCASLAQQLLQGRSIFGLVLRRGNDLLLQ